VINLSLVLSRRKYTLLCQIVESYFPVLKAYFAAQIDPLPNHVVTQLDDFLWWPGTESNYRNEDFWAVLFQVSRMAIHKYPQTMLFISFFADGCDMLRVGPSVLVHFPTHFYFQLPNIDP